MVDDVVNVPEGWRHSRGNHLNDWSLLDLLHYHASFSVAGLFGPSGSDIFERYATSRSIALLIAVLCCIGFRSRMGIAVLALVMTLVQGFDGLIGALAHDPASTYGPFALALANFAALRPVHRLRATRERRSSIPDGPASISDSYLFRWIR